MKHTSLATLYRPQTFAEVAGQEMVTTVLSRAAAADRVAPAYLLSGTRGVGKTTIARILAKALNCVHAPGPEPCNVCEQCRKITLGNHVDVAEIDGASNNSVEDARALRENIGYAPMEGRFKVFIIDEAHMLSRSAFNALLKTLEEPPPRVIFVFATTEAHKFPITIISRCQHFVFKRLPEAALEAHLTRILEREKAPFEPQAVRLLARRAAGSVRDGMSLLGQTLAFSDKGLTVEATRTVLGLAGQDMFARLLKALAAQDCVTIIDLLRELLDQGVDIGFFLRELTTLWRTLFLLRQAGKAILPSLDLPEDEARLWLELTPHFSLAHMHAAWHMVLDAQRKVIHSPEPAAALELLLLNIALMPRLLPLERLPQTEGNQDSIRQESLPQRVPLPPPVAATKPEPAPKPAPKAAPAPRPFVWEDFCAHCVKHSEGQLSAHVLRQVQGQLKDGVLALSTETSSVYQRLENALAMMHTLAETYCGTPVPLRLAAPPPTPKTETVLKEEFTAREELKPCLEILEATITRVLPLIACTSLDHP